MSQKRSGRTNRRGAVSSRRNRLVVVTLALMCVVATSMLAQVNLQRKSKKASGEISVMSLTPSSPSKEYVYAGGKLVATEEPTSSSCTPPPSPGNTLFATAQSSNLVELTWAVCSGAHHYEVQWKDNVANLWSNLPNPPTNNCSDSTVVGNHAYIYRVRAVDASGNCPSEYSNVDLATTFTFTGDDPLQSHVTTIKTQNVTELRQAIDLARIAANIGGASWTPLDQIVRAPTFSELRVKLNEALIALEVSPIPSDPGMAVGNIVYAVHLQAVRDKVK